MYHVAKGLNPNAAMFKRGQKGGNHLHAHRLVALWSNCGGGFKFGRKSPTLGWISPFNLLLVYLNYKLITNQPECD